MRKQSRISLTILGMAFTLLCLTVRRADAHTLTNANASVTCSSYTMTVAGNGLSPSGSVIYSITGTNSSGTSQTVSGSIAVSPTDSNGDFQATVTVGIGPLNDNYTLSGTAELFATNSTETSGPIPITFMSGNSVACSPTTPPPPPPCVATATNSSNFNGTFVPAGTYLWFNANFTANHVPASGVTIDFTNGNISLSSGGKDYSIAVPNAKITFSPSATCSSTTFDSVTNTWMTTVPISGDDEVFLTGVAVPVPSGGLPGGANPVNFSGTYSSESSAPGLSINMKWSVAAYSHFTTDYNALQIKAGHQTACGPSNGDHAGTPEGSDNTDTQWKKYLVGGPRGGGGSNFTGSWSGTISIPICP